MKNKRNVRYIKLLALLFGGGAVITLIMVNSANKKKNYKKVLDKINGFSEADSETMKQTSFKDREYKNMSDSIFNALDGYTSDDDKNIVIHILERLKNEGDWLKLKKAFGLKEASSNVPFTDAFKGDIVKWLNDELEYTEYAPILEKINVNV